jgi:prophage antirepressor-like protein
MFKSNNKQMTEIITNETSLMVKQFENLNITIYGTYENPLFKAKDIGDLLGIDKIRKTIENLDNECKIKINAPTGGVGTNNSDTWFLTEDGLYEVLFISRKPIAKQFKVWVRNVIKEIRLKGKYDLEEQLKLKDIETQRLLEEKELQLQEKELELIKYKEKVYEEIEKTGHIYVIKTDGGTKVGKTKDAVKKRIKGLQTGNMNDIQVLLDFKTSNADLLERTVHYILDRYRCNSNREFFDCDVDFIKTVVETIGKVIDTLKSCYQQITKEQILTKLSENGIKINLEINSETGSEKTFVNEEKEESELYNWLNNNIELDKNGILKLKKICELYLDTDTIYPKLSNKIRLEIESWIKTKFKHLNFQYKDSYLNGERYRGWCGLKLK